jgi:TP901 family phage tail tape measure protein
MANEDLNIIIKAQDKASKTLNKTQREVKGVGTASSKTSKNVGGLSSSLGGIVNPALLAATAILGIGAAFASSVKKAAEFETLMTNISTLMDGDATEAVEKLGDGILEMTTKVPKSADELGAAAYDIVSAGISDTSEALMVLEASSKLAVTGLGDTGEATDLMTSALNAFQIPASESAKVSDTLFKTVKAGKTTVTELAVGFGKLAPVAKSMSVSFEEVQAATAAVTTTGIKAAEVQTGMKAVLSNLIKPTAQLNEVFGELNVKTGKELIESSGGLVPALDAVKTKGTEMGLEFGTLLGSVEGLTVAESLLGAQNETFTQTLENMNDPASAIDEAFQKQTETFDSQKELLKNQLNKVMIELGSAILPPLTEAIKLVTGESGSLIDRITSLFAIIDERTGIITFLKEQFDELVRVVKEDLLPSIMENKDSLILFAKVAGGVVVGALTAVIFIVIRLATLWAQLISIMNTVGAAMKGVGETFGRVAGSIVGSFSPVLSVIDRILGALGRLNSAIGNVLSRVPGLTAASELAGRVFGSNATGSSFIPRTGLYQLHKGEAVTTAAEARNTNSGGGEISNSFNNMSVRNDNDLQEIVSAIEGRSQRKMELEQKFGI